MSLFPITDENVQSHPNPIEFSKESLHNTIGVSVVKAWLDDKIEQQEYHEIDHVLHSIEPKLYTPAILVALYHGTYPVRHSLKHRTTFLKNHLSATLAVA